MGEVWEYLRIIICIVMCSAICIGCTIDIASRIYFAKPIEKKYNIMLKADYSKGLVAYIIARVFEVGIILFYFFIAYAINKIAFAILVMAYIVICIHLRNKYKKYGILEYINNFSVDLFDWDKIYVLNIDEDLKRRCFAIHNINYDEYKGSYLKHLQLKQDMLDMEINQIEKEITDIVGENNNECS